MSFDLVIVGVRAESEQALDAIISGALTRFGASSGRVVEIGEGAWMEWSSSHASQSIHLSLRGEPALWSLAVFALAEATRAYVVPVESPRAIRLPATGAPPDAVAGLNLIEVGNARQLAEALDLDVSSFVDFRDQITHLSPSVEPAPTGLLSSLFGRKR